MFEAYVALGDSMSIDSYPAFDAERAGIHTQQQIGSAALFYKKDLSRFRNVNVVATLTIGGNDLLSTYRRMTTFNRSEATDQLLDICNRYQRILRMLKVNLQKLTLITTTVFDPTDDTGILPTVGNELPMNFLTSLNSWVKQSAYSENVLLADVYTHFLGHGATARANGDYWYLRTNPIEPGYRGASKIRRVWIETLQRTESERVSGPN